MATIATDKLKLQKFHKKRKSFQDGFSKTATCEGGGRRPNFLLKNFFEVVETFTNVC